MVASSSCLIESKSVSDCSFISVIVVKKSFCMPASFSVSMSANTDSMSRLVGCFSCWAVAPSNLGVSSAGWVFSSSCEVMLLDLSVMFGYFGWNATVPSRPVKVWFKVVSVVS